MYRLKEFIDLISGQQKFLNKFARQGYMLEKTGVLFYKFSKTTCNKHYMIQYIADKNESEYGDYLQMLQDTGYKVYSCPYNIAKTSLLSFKLRLVKNKLLFKRLNNEILIIEADVKKNADLDLYNNYDEIINYCKKERNILIYIDFIISLLILFGNTSFSFMGRKLVLENNILSIFFLSIEIALLIVVTISIILKQLVIYRYRNESLLYE